MEKLCFFFVLAILANQALGMSFRRTRQAETGSTTMSPTVRACIRNCPVTSEYNPVCGTDSQRYDNPGRLECAQNCGVPVSFLREAPCPPPTTAAPGNEVPQTTTTARPAVSTPMPPSVQECILNCPSTPEYNPVCGTDMVQYNNPGRLGCAQSCGVNVTLFRTSPCPVAS